MVLDPQAFLNEVKKLREAGLPNLEGGPDGQLFISNRAQVILPYHRMIELAAETAPGRTPIGTTRRGIGPAYEDKVHRNGLRVADLLNNSLLRTHINNACHEKNTIAHALFGTEPLDPRAMYEGLRPPRRPDRTLRHRHCRAAQPGHRRRRKRHVRRRAGCPARYRPRNVSICDQFLLDRRRRGHRHRRRPHQDRHRHRRHQAYVTRVGEGPFPTEIEGHSAELLRARGQEYGAVTGRPRRCGWLDLPLLRYSNMINGTEWLVVTKMDVLDQSPEIPICTAYEIDGKTTDLIPADIRGFRSIKPIYTTLKGWNCTTEGITEYDQLPQAARDYLSFIEQHTGARIGMISTGPDRTQTHHPARLRRSHPRLSPARSSSYHRHKGSPPCLPSPSGCASTSPTFPPSANTSSPSPRARAPSPAASPTSATSSPIRPTPSSSTSSTTTEAALEAHRNTPHFKQHAIGGLYQHMRDRHIENLVAVA